MDDVQDPSVWLQIGQFLSQQFGPSGLVLFLVAAGLGWALFRLHKACRDDMAGAWVRVTQISEARTADSQNMLKAISDNTIALARVAERVDIADRRNR